MRAFVLSGGGSRGALQVGALQVLLELGIMPDMIVGTSAGALNAAFFAADPTQEGLEKLRDIWLQLSEKDIFSGNRGTALLRFVRGRASLYESDRMCEILTHHLPVTRFSELPIPCYAVATDVDSGELVTFGDDDEDRLVDGLMSSAALAPAHPPWIVGDRRFVDGAFGATLPVRQAIARGATEIIALSLNTLLEDREKVQSAFDIMIQVTDIMTRQQVKADLAYAAAHSDLTTIVLESNINVPIADFSRTADRIERGRAVTTAVLQAHPLYSHQA